MMPTGFRDPLPPRPALLPAWLWPLLGLACVLAGMWVAFRLWAPQVVRQYQAVLASTPNNTLLYADDGQLVATIQGAEDRSWVPISRISPFMQKAAVAIEDRRFFEHNGTDPVRLAGALWADLRSFSLDQGGSTITQQLIKLSLLSSERTLTRKFKELFMAMALEEEVPKLRILESYLNKVYLGNGQYGVEQAAQGYFGTSADALTLNQAAFLAALVKRPEGYLQPDRPDPHPDSEDLPLALLHPLMRRQRAVLDAVHRLGWVSDEDYEAARQETLVARRPHAALSEAPYFVQQALKELKDVLAVSSISGQGYRVYTTLNLRQQRAAEELISSVPKREPQASQGALVAMDPTTGSVTALVGGVDFARSQFNRATQALRQPGSAFKPVLYAAALEAGFSPVAVFQDEPVRITWSGGKTDFQRTMTVGDVAPDASALAAAPPGPPPGSASAGPQAAANGPQAYEPHNFDNQYGLPALRNSLPPGALPGEAPDRRMTLGRAVELSSNVVAVQVLDQLGMNPVVSLASHWNLTVRPELGLCVALGCSEVQLMNLTAAYASFANGGLRVAPTLITRVTNSEGEVLYQRTPALPEHVISDWTAFQLRKLLEGVVERGTGRGAAIGRLAGGKTGTNDGPRDTWFIGFTPTLLAGVWIGNDDNRIMPGEVGGHTTAHLWADFMRQVLPPPDGQGFPEPSEAYVSYRICNLDGRIAGPDCPDADTYYFQPGQVPPGILPENAAVAGGADARGAMASVAPAVGDSGFLPPPASASVAAPRTNVRSGSSTASEPPAAGDSGFIPPPTRAPAAAPARAPAPAPPSSPGGPAAAAFAERLKDAFSSQPRSVPPE